MVVFHKLRGIAQSSTCHKTESVSTIGNAHLVPVYSTGSDQAILHCTLHCYKY